MEDIIIKKSNIKKTALFVIVAIILILFFLNRGKDFVQSAQSTTQQESAPLTAQQNEKHCTDISVPYDAKEEYQDTEEYLKTEYYTETVPYTNQECDNKELAYSIPPDSFILTNKICNKKEYICKKTVLSICTEKEYYCIDQTMGCSLILKNLDNEKGGVWEVTFSYDTSAKQTVKTQAIPIFLYPQTEQTFSSTINLQSSGVEGDANKDLTCYRQVTKTPTKQVCRDVTKYKDIQRERQVTAYRPITKTKTVTKYKTEQQCD